MEFAQNATFEEENSFWPKKANVWKSVQVLIHRLIDTHVMLNARLISIESGMNVFSVERNVLLVQKQGFVMLVIRGHIVIFSVLHLRWSMIIRT